MSANRAEPQFPSHEPDRAAPSLEPVATAGASAARNTLSPSAIGDKLLTDYWNVSQPRHFDVKAGGTLTYDVSALTSDGRMLARAALDEWSTVTGLKFREVLGGFRPSAEHREVGDAAASTSTAARAALGEALDGRVGSGDRDWVRIDLADGQVAKIAVTGWGKDALKTPGLTLFDALGRQIPIGVQHGGSSAEVTVAANKGGGTYYAQVTGIGGATGSYRLALAEPGGRGGADIAFDDDLAGAHAEFVLAGDRILSADVNVSTRWLADNGTALGSYSFQTYLHEIGHALGLGHPGDYNDRAGFDQAEFANDSWQTSVMSYFSQRENPNVDADKAYAVTPMIGDLVAVRRLYGDAPVRPDHTSYGEGSKVGGMLDRVAGHSFALAFTILDTGGTDHIRLASQRADQRLDLREGAISDVFGHEGNMVIALGTVIENATLGRGDDRVIGNDAANRIWGNDGEDRIKGGAGDDDLHGGGDGDRIFGDAGADVVHGDEGSDRIWGGRGNDVLWGGDGSDRLKGGSGADRLEGSGGNDVLVGGSGADAIDGGRGRDTITGGSSRDDLRGGGGDDTLRGGGSDDRLRGDSGDDRLKGDGGDDDLHGGSGGDRVQGGSGSDRMRGGSGDDELSGSSGSDRIEGQAGADEIAGDGGSDRLEGGSGRDRLDGGSGRDVLDGGSGDDTLTGGSGDDTFLFRGIFGRDRVTDFDARDRGERIDLSQVGAIRSWDDLADDHLRARGGDVVIDAGDAGRILLEDVSLDALDAHDFLF